MFLVYPRSRTLRSTIARDRWYGQSLINGPLSDDLIFMLSYVPFKVPTSTVPDVFVPDLSYTQKDGHDRIPHFLPKVLSDILSPNDTTPKERVARRSSCVMMKLIHVHFGIESFPRYVVIPFSLFFLSTQVLPPTMEC